MATTHVAYELMTPGTGVRARVWEAYVAPEHVRAAVREAYAEAKKYGLDPFQRSGFPRSEQNHPATWCPDV